MDRSNQTERRINSASECRSPRWYSCARQLVCVVVVAIVMCALNAPTIAAAKKIDEMSLDRWAKLREVERYQLNIAEKYYAKGDFKIAKTEYEKYLKLYERSEAAPYAQFKWSICMAKLRKLNTAINDGYRSVIDYWPDSADATKAAYMIAVTYRQMGQVSKAKKAFADVIENYAKKDVAIRSRWDLLSIARDLKDEKAILEALDHFTFKQERTSDLARSYGSTASRDLATHFLYAGDHAKATEALETTYKTDGSLVYYLYIYARSPISRLVGQDKSKLLGLKLADHVIERIQSLIPDALTDDKIKAAAKDNYYRVASVHSYARRPAEVVKVYNQMMKTFGVDDGILDHLAGWYLSQKRRDDARQTYAKFENQINGQSKIAKTWRDERKFDKAIAVYEDLDKKDEDAGTKWRWAIATAYDEWGKYKEAIANYRLTENYPANLNAMAMCYRRLKQYNEALGLYGQVIGAYPSSAPSAQYNIGSTYEQMNKKESAIRAFRVVCKNWPTSGNASRAHAHLQNKYKISVTLGGAKEN